MRYQGFEGPEGELFKGLDGFLSPMPLNKLGLMSFFDGSQLRGSYQVYQGYYQSLTQAIRFLLAFIGGSSGYQPITGFSLDLPISNFPLFLLNTGVGLGLLLTTTFSCDSYNSICQFPRLFSEAKFGASFLSPFKILFFLNPNDGLCTDPGSCYFQSSIFLTASYMLVLGFYTFSFNLPVGGRCIMFQAQDFFYYLNYGSWGFYFFSLPICNYEGEYVCEGFFHL